MRARVGPKKGYPVLREEDKALIPGPDASYNETDTPGRAKPKMYTPQPKMPFCRSGACDVASVRCKEKNYYPVITKIEINGKTNTFSTIPQTATTWWIRFGCKRTCVHVPCVLACAQHEYLCVCTTCSYCHADRIPRTSDMAKKLLLYFFYGIKLRSTSIWGYCCCVLACPVTTMNTT